MGLLQDSSERWATFFKTYHSTAALKQDVLLKQHDASPCDAGIRSICWRLFLQLPSFSPSTWPPVLSTSRAAYSELRTKMLQLVETGVVIAYDDDPQHLIDPLDLVEDPSNPWSQLRKDEELRKEILQDVERCMPDQPYFRSEKVQKHLLDILFVYCKLNPEIGYRQGMHELVAPILWVVDNDSVEAPPYLSEEDEVDAENERWMLDALNPEYVEHDTFALFQVAMASAKSWYELGEDRKIGASSIVEKSRVIHETYLMAVDPELGNHLKNLDILPQVFLIRWIRLLFGREFPFDQLLVLWDSLFAEDPKLTLVDYICVAMLLRIRWELLESDYSTSLALLLRYPTPSPPNLPASFVSDAIYLRNNLTLSGGAHIIAKYSGRTPKPATKIISPPQSPPGSPSRQPATPRSILRTSSPLSAPVKFIQAQGVGVGAGLDWLVNDVAKGVLDRGEKWGVNKAVRDVMVEVKRNVEGLQQQQNGHGESDKVIKQGHSEARTVNIPSKKKRSHVLAEMLGKSLEDLEKVFGDYGGGIAEGNEKQAISRAALDRIHLVKACLFDSSISIDEAMLLPPPSPSAAPPQLSESQPQLGESPLPPSRANSPSRQVHKPPFQLAPPTPHPQPEPRKPLTPITLQPYSSSTQPSSPLNLPALPPSPLPPITRSSMPSPSSSPPPQQSPPPKSRSPSPPPPPPPPKPVLQKVRKQHFPSTSLSSKDIGVKLAQDGRDTHKARSSLAQSEFAWMLGEDPLQIRRSEGTLGGSGVLFGDKANEGDEEDVFGSLRLARRKRGEVGGGAGGGGLFGEA